MNSIPSQSAARLKAAPPSAPRDCIAVEASALELNLSALRPLLSDPDVTELCINRPGEAFIETRAGWRTEALPFADYAWCHRLAKLVANSTRQRIDE
jgi:type IV secretion system protein VirB11